MVVTGRWLPLKVTCDSLYMRILKLFIPDRKPVLGIPLPILLILALHWLVVIPLKISLLIPLGGSDQMEYVNSLIMFVLFVLGTRIIGKPVIESASCRGSMPAGILKASDFITDTFGGDDPIPEMSVLEAIAPVVVVTISYATFLFYTILLGRNLPEFYPRNTFLFAINLIGNALLFTFWFAVSLGIWLLVWTHFWSLRRIDLKLEDDNSLNRFLRLIEDIIRSEEPVTRFIKFKKEFERITKPLMEFAVRTLVFMLIALVIGATSRSEMGGAWVKAGGYVIALSLLIPLAIAVYIMVRSSFQLNFYIITEVRNLKLKSVRNSDHLLYDSIKEFEEIIRESRFIFIPSKEFLDLILALISLIVALIIS